MERFWRTLRENVLDHLGSITSQQDISFRIQALLDVHYHPSPHAGLMGRAPALVYARAARDRRPVRGSPARSADAPAASTRAPRHDRRRPRAALRARTAS
ncbi:hypothetical protein WME94_06225 [Sorangium sp. So ce429]